MATKSSAPPAARIIACGLGIGFCAVGIADVHGRRNDAERLDRMIAENRHGEMRYLEKRREERADPARLLHGARSIVSAALPYDGNRASGPGCISAYALSRDYHVIVRRKLEELLACIREIHGGRINAHILVDSEPLFEKSWAEEAGTGKKGKNTLLIVPGAGSYVFLGEILLDVEIEHGPAEALPDPCGDCDACIRACPTGALAAPGKLDARRCISYLTVELKREFTPEERDMTGEWLFGCDLCQWVCPHNAPERRIAPAPETGRLDRLRHITPETVLSLTGSGFKTLFAGTPILRTGLKRLKRNARAVMENREKGKIQK
ncbi:tRNA epoxyqueuosine(34) reductase QueG [Prosthecochloris sp. GSB1]|uniref:tRNA epoxyqueuosine(34) reductase QueG n=1 Tax=Prosthecochloris sp. GSB1 TaxID=281093 RepID=UPI000B8C890E|nr:tRNA epoxyqueuosine(34) reductase QueG [Prosthecochloris sp. GSB1]ASQ89983.1 tRNA epoxyqueuosine(34) reductase QueG [Prosthecochloris sp. GSB1]